MSEVSSVKNNFIHYINHVIKNNKVSHAYLIEVDNYQEDFHYVYDFIKMIICNITYEELTTNNNSILSLIDKGNYPDIKVIEPDGTTIKKNQLMELQLEYSNKSLLNGKRIYILKEAEKLNLSSANTMLKFLEEPEDNIIAFLITDNRYHVLETILSRCQVLTLKENVIDSVEEDDDIFELLSCIIDPKSFFVKHNYLLENVVADKFVCIEKLNVIKKMLIQFLNVKYLNQSSINPKFISCLEEMEEKKLLNYLSIIEEEMAKLEFNINYKMWIDSLFSKLIIGG